MNQQEIKNKMTQGTWVASPTGWSDIEFGVYDKAKYAFGTFVIGSCNSNFYQLGVCNTLAITHAINNTYGRNINPDSVNSMHLTLCFVLAYLTQTGANDLAEKVQQVLNEAKLSDDIPAQDQQQALPETT